MRRLIGLLMTGASIAAAGAGAAQPRRHAPRAAPGIAGPAATVRAFEQAYERKDKKRMLFQLMAPSNDAEVLEKRYQWFRGYGPHDLPGTRHQPILFETSQGSFVPTDYRILSLHTTGPASARAVVEEHGKYHDEDGNWKVERQRVIKLTKYHGKWMVADYVLRSNQEDYGFYVDDISDRMTKL